MLRVNAEAFARNSRLATRNFFIELGYNRCQWKRRRFNSFARTGRTSCRAWNIWRPNGHWRPPKKLRGGRRIGIRWRDCICPCRNRGGNAGSGAGRESSGWIILPADRTIRSTGRTIVQSVGHGQILIAGWGSIQPAINARQAQMELGLYVDVFLGAVYPMGEGRVVAIIPDTVVELPTSEPMPVDELIRRLPAHSIVLSEADLKRGQNIRGDDGDLGATARAVPGGGGCDGEPDPADRGVSQNHPRRLRLRTGASGNFGHGAKTVRWGGSHERNITDMATAAADEGSIFGRSSGSPSSCSESFRITGTNRSIPRRARSSTFR